MTMHKEPTRYCKYCNLVCDAKKYNTQLHKCERCIAASKGKLPKEIEHEMLLVTLGKAEQQMSDNSGLSNAKPAPQELVEKRRRIAEKMDQLKIDSEYDY